MDTRAGQLALTLTTAGILLLGGCSGGTTNDSAAGADNGGAGMMGASQYQDSARTCKTPASLPGTVVRVQLGDMDMAKMMQGDAPMDARMRLRVSKSTVPAGKVSLVVSNMGWRTHELVVLPLGSNAAAGQRVHGAAGHVSEAGSLGEASRSCGAGTGEGITSGSAGWTTLTLPRGRYELICNLRNNYADGMRHELDVS